MQLQTVASAVHFKAMPQHAIQGCTVRVPGHRTTSLLEADARERCENV